MFHKAGLFRSSVSHQSQRSKEPWQLGGFKPQSPIAQLRANKSLLTSSFPISTTGIMMSFL